MKIINYPSKAVLLATVAVLSILVISSCRSRKARSASKAQKTMQVAADKFDEADVAEKLEAIFSPRAVSDSVFDKKMVYGLTEVLQKSYKEEDYFPIWLTQNGDISYIAALIADLEAMKLDGLNPERYKLTELKNLLAKYKSSSTASVDDIVHFDTTCTQSYLLASRDLLLGALIPKRADSLWHHANDSVWKPYTLLAALGRADADYPALDSFRSKYKTYTLLRETLKKYNLLVADSNYLHAKKAVGTPAFTDSIKYAIIVSELPWEATHQSGSTIDSDFTQAYQYYIGAKDHRKKDSLTQAYLKAPLDSLMVRAAANMERLRWMQQIPEEKYVLVNVPQMELFFRIKGENAMHMEVVVGRTLRQTPSIYADMANVVINPPWGVPPTIMKKDVLPGVIRSGEAYLRRKGLKAYDFKGRQVSASGINSSNYKRYVIRQAPGESNALGNVKFNLPNKWDIYLHDTPHREDFGKKDRFLSSGCIRVQRPKELAEFILAEIEGRNFNREILDSVIQTRKTRYEVLKNKIPVHIVYLTAFEDTTGTRLHFMPDVYKRDAKLQAMLK